MNGLSLEDIAKVDVGKSNRSYEGEDDVEDDDDFEDEALNTFLTGLELGGTEFTIFADKRVSLESLIAVANMGEDETYVIDWLKDKLPTLVEDARKKIGTKAFDSANGGATPRAQA